MWYVFASDYRLVLFTLTQREAIEYCQANRGTYYASEFSLQGKEREAVKIQHKGLNPDCRCYVCKGD